MQRTDGWDPCPPTAIIRHAGGGRVLVGARQKENRHSKGERKQECRLIRGLQCRWIDRHRKQNGRADPGPHLGAGPMLGEPASGAVIGQVRPTPGGRMGGSTTELIVWCRVGGEGRGRGLPARVGGKVGAGRPCVLEEVRTAGPVWHRCAEDERQVRLCDSALADMDGPLRLGRVYCLATTLQAR